MTNIFRCLIDNESFLFEDATNSHCCHYIEKELNEDCYGLKKMHFGEGDVVLDIGGHIGMFAIPLIRRHPNLIVHSFEPMPINYEHFQKNMRRNDVKGNLKLHRLAITSDGRDVLLSAKDANSGSASICFRQGCAHHGYAHSTTLAAFLSDFKIDNIKLLKVDCEGTELELLTDNTTILERVEFLALEVHKTKFRRIGIDCQAFVDTLRRSFVGDRLTIKIL
jgi:FkbM family methyltransferase